jgi:sulfite reductase (NADPH) hemoprotein beta-component
MYQYDQYDHLIVRERIAQYRDQVRRRLADELTEAEFLPLRLQNGLYMQRHAYMLRIAVPYGLLASKQMRMFAHIARTTVAMATSPPVKTSSLTGLSWNRPRIS